MAGPINATTSVPPQTTTTLDRIRGWLRVAFWSFLNVTLWSNHHTTCTWLQPIFIFLVFLKNIWQVCTFLPMRRSKNGSQNGCVNLGMPNEKKLFLKYRLSGKNVSIEPAITYKINFYCNLSGFSLFLVVTDLPLCWSSSSDSHRSPTPLIVF